jgi:hypothetical protein
MNSRVLMRKAIITSLLALTLVLGGAVRSRADATYSLADNGSGNAASATFTSVAGGIEITVTNNEANTGDIANAVSQVQFTFNPATVGQASSLTELSGLEISYSGKGAGTVTGPFDYAPVSNDPNLHWSLDPTNAHTTSLVNVSGGGLTGPGGQPDELIVALNSMATANSPASHNPSFDGTAHFFLADALVPANLTASDITGVKFSFGTTPETVLSTGTVVLQSVPEPSSLVLGGTAALLGLGIAWRRRKR